MLTSYLNILKRAYDRPGLPGMDGVIRVRLGGRSPYAVRTFRTNDDKVDLLGKSQIAMMKDPTVTLRDCDKAFELNPGTMGNLAVWLAKGRLPEASKELVAFHKMRTDTQHIRAAEASKAATARNNGRRRKSV